MNSARERAVEAGARAVVACQHKRGKDRLEYCADMAEACISAAFPILAEELVEAALAQGARYEKSEEDVCQSAYSMSQEIATALRARIQQMAEAE